MYYKYHHPKEVYISNGILNREINRAAGKKVGPATFEAGLPEAGKFNPKYVQCFPLRSIDCEHFGPNRAGCLVAC